MKRSYLAISAILVWCVTAHAQQPATGFSRIFLSAASERLNAPTWQWHDGLQPAAHGLENDCLVPLDSAHIQDAYTSKLKWLPLASVAGGASVTTQSNALVLAGAGAGLQWQHQSRWSASLGYSYYYLQSHNFFGRVADSLHVVPGVGYAHRGAKAQWYSHYSYGHVGYAAGKYFHLEAGKGKHFWGYGERSLILSDVAANYPYVRIDTRIWHIKYTNLWMRLRDISLHDKLSAARTKYAALHALSWNATKRLSLSFYEMVIWQDRDSLNRRSLDLNYLNPVIFYRPVEYAQGSADNVILGFGARFKVDEHIQVYGQLVLDEFLLTEIKAARGWWANKFGGQLGARFFNVGIKGLHFQTEFNGVRPFTYTHGSPVQAWGHMNQPLAHPLGANFLEWVNLWRYSKGPWSISEEFVWAGFGRDYDSDDWHGGIENYGGNIFNSYRSPRKTYGNTVMQGLKSVFHFHRLEVSRRLEERYNLEVFFSHSWRFEKNIFIRHNDHYFMLGLRTPLLRPSHAF